MPLYTHARGISNISLHSKTKQTKRSMINMSTVSADNKVASTADQLTNQERWDSQKQTHSHGRCLHCTVWQSGQSVYLHHHRYDIHFELSRFSHRLRNRISVVGRWLHANIKILVFTISKSKFAIQKTSTWTFILKCHNSHMRRELGLWAAVDLQKLHGITWKGP